VREDFQRARDIIYKEGLSGLSRALEQGVPLPAALLAPLTMDVREDGWWRALNSPTSKLRSRRLKPSSPQPPLLKASADCEDETNRPTGTDSWVEVRRAGNGARRSFAAAAFPSDIRQRAKQRLAVLANHTAGGRDRHGSPDDRGRVAEQRKGYRFG
jgi:hypothetical protein